MQFCMKEVQENGLMKDMEDRIHVNEKWFYLTKDAMKYYLASDEDVQN